MKIGWGYQRILPLLVTGNLVACISGKPPQQLASASVATVTDVPKKIELALETAKKEGKYVLLDFYADWCGPCQKIEALMKTKPVEEILSQHYVVVKIKDEEPETEALRKTYHVEGYPALMVLNKEGETLQNLVPKNNAKIQEPAFFRKCLLDIVQGVVPIVRLLETWQSLKPVERSAAEASKIAKEYVNQQREGEALEWVERVIQLDASQDPNGYSVQVLFMLAFDLYLHGLENEEKALALFRRIRREYAQSAFVGPAAEEEAKLLWKRGDKIGVQTLFEDQMRRAPENISIPLFYAIFSFRHQWNREAAKAALLEAQKKDPSNPEIAQWLHKFSQENQKE